MRNLFLTLVLANLLLLAWQLWIDPSVPVPAPGPAGSRSGTSLDLYGRAAGPDRALPEAPRAPVPTLVPASDPSAASCLRLGPLPSEDAAQQARAALMVRGIDAAPIARDAQLWLGHWVQIPGFSSVADAEAARQRLVAGGLPDAYLMQDGPRPMISLGVFRDRGGADRVAAAAQGLGFPVSVRDRYRPTVEQWLLVRLAPGQVLAPDVLSLADDRIMRADPVPCDKSGPVPAGSPEPATAAPLPTRPD